MRETYRIMPLYLGANDQCPPAVFYYKAIAPEPLETLAFGCFALESRRTGEIIMVDTGLASQKYMKENQYPWGIEKLPGAPSLEEVLQEKEIDPLAVKTIVFTHLHQDHCANLELFPNAELYVQRIEMEHAAAPTEIEAHSYMKMPYPGMPFWACGFSRFHFLEGDCRLRDGIDVMLTPGHTPGSQTVIVQTEEGPYLLPGDNYYNMDQFEKKIMNANFTDLQGWYSSWEKVMEYMRVHGGRLLPGHDKLTYQKEIYG